MERFVWICLAGAAGTGTRYLIALWADRSFGTAFPYGTLIVNLAGCFLMAAIMQLAATAAWSPALRATVTIGFLGGLTTYSSFNDETARLLQSGASGLAVANAALTVAGGFLAGWLGVLAGRSLVNS